MLSFFRLERKQKKIQIHFEFAYFSSFLTYLELKINTIVHSYTPVVPSRTIPDSRPKWAKCITVFGPKQRKNPTRWGGTYLYSLPKLVPPGSWALQTALLCIIIQPYRVSNCSRHAVYFFLSKGQIKKINFVVLSLSIINAALLSKGVIY